jgi:hypothetical protein
MSSTKVMRAPELRAEIARKQVSRPQMAKDLGISYDYLRKILLGQRDAPLQRARMTEYLIYKRATAGLYKAGDKTIRIESCKECPHRTEHVLVGKPHQRCGIAIKWVGLARGKPVALTPDIEPNVNDGTIHSCCPLEKAQEANREAV